MSRAKPCDAVLPIYYRAGMPEPVPGDRYGTYSEPSQRYVMASR